MDWTGLLTALLQVLGGAAITALVVGAARKALTRIPRVLILPLALILGVVAEWLSAQVAGVPMSPVLALAYGTGATWLRELVNTAAKHGVEP